MGSSDFANMTKTNTSFIVKNISPSHRTIKIFNTKIPYSMELDLLSLPGISENSISTSLFKGELKYKIERGILQIVFSDLNSNADQLNFLKNNNVNTKWEEQTAWYIDNTDGSDTALGNTSSAALKTHAELMRRLAGKIVDVRVTITILTDMPENNPVNVSGFTIGPNGFLHYKGTPSTVTSNSFTSVTNINTATNTALQVGCTGISGGSWASYVGKRIRITSGAAEGAITWVAKSLSGTNARVAAALIPWTPEDDFPPPNFPFQWSNINLTNGSSFVIENLTSINSFTVNVFHSTKKLNETSSHIAFTDFDFSPDSAILNTYSSSLIVFNGCDMGAPNGTCRMWLLSCRQGFSLLTASGITYASAGLFNEGISVYTAGYAYFEAYTLFQHDDNTSFFVAGGQVDCYGAQAFDGFNGMDVGYGSNMYVGGDIFGSGNSGSGIAVGSGSRVIYDSVPTITGTDGDLSVGGSAKTWGDVPFINTDNNAAFIENA